MPRTLLSGVVARLNAVASATGRPSATAVQNAITDFPGCVFVADANGRLVAASEVALDTIGHTVTSLRSLSVTDISGPTEPAERLWEAFRRQRGQSGQYALRCKSGIVRTRYAATANVIGQFSVAVHILPKR